MADIFQIIVVKNTQQSELLAHEPSINSIDHQDKF
jgi:hypothetical protein